MFHLPQVNLLADEGRSALKRMKRKFDVIQMVNSHNADLLLSGALSISETYIYTVESFKDYWEHLQPDGFVYIVHWNGERLFATALKALRELGVERPEDKFFIVQYPGRLQQFLPQEGRLHRRRITRSSRAPSGSRGRSSSPRTRRRTTSTPTWSGDLDAAVRGSSVNIAPVYDNSPYFNQPNRIGQFRFTNQKLKGMADKVVRSAIVYSNSIYLSILGLALLFSFVLHLPAAPAAADGRRGQAAHPLFLLHRPGLHPGRDHLHQDLPAVPGQPGRLDLHHHLLPAGLVRHREPVLGPPRPLRSARAASRPSPSFWPSLLTAYGLGLFPAPERPDVPPLRPAHRWCPSS